MMLFLAEIASQADKVGVTKEPSFLREFVQMMITLVFVLGLAVVSLMLLRKLMRSRAVVLNDNSAIRVIEKRALTQKSSIYLIDVLGKGIVIAESPQGIEMISEFPPGTDVGLLANEAQIEKKPKSAGLFSKFSQKLEEMKEKKPKA